MQQVLQSNHPPMSIIDSFSLIASSSLSLDLRFFLPFPLFLACFF
jgi:hypothetical protein